MVWRLNPERLSCLDILTSKGFSKILSPVETCCFYRNFPDLQAKQDALESFSGRLAKLRIKNNATRPG